MARGRIISPDFWTDGKMIGLSAFARLFYIGTWNFALCDQGHLPDDAAGLKLKVLPADAVDAGELLDELIVAGRVVRISGPEGRSFLHIPTFSDHQRADTRWRSRCPVCAHQNTRSLPETQPSLPEHADTRTNSGQRGEERRGEERKGSAKRGSRIRSDFSITPEMRAWAANETPLVDVDRKLPEFIDYWQGVPGAKGVKVDWVSTWRNGMRKQQEFAERDRATAPAAVVVPPPTVPKWMQP